MRKADFDYYAVGNLRVELKLLEVIQRPAEPGARRYPGAIASRRLVCR